MKRQQEGRELGICGQTETLPNFGCRHIDRRNKHLVGSGLATSALVVFKTVK